ncbi:MAG TPA: hypothetical protein DEF82_05075 [Crocinitomicaceae bacterium]|nr:RNA polymerase sigma factor [Flavobacteriales bacterium]HBW86116.1 hypothetical protein [Crocinitomicaceae bacterium]
MKTISIYENLVNRCVNRDEKAQKELYELFCIPMYNLCLRLAKNKFEAEDIYQDSFIKVFENLKYLKNKNMLPGWIKKIFVRTAIDKIRMNKVDLIPIENSYNLKTESFDAIDLLQESDILELINSLPNKSRTVFLLYVVEGYSHKEIAEMMNINEGTSKSQLFDARNSLKKQIKKMELSLSRLEYAEL